MNVLGLALYGPLAASTRLRLTQYAPGLAGIGFNLTTQSLLNDAYLRSRFEGHHLPIGSLLTSGWERLRLLLKKDSYQLAIVHCELFPLLPARVERLLLSVPYVYDFDDAFYLRYRRGALAGLQPFLGRKFDSVMSGAAAVTAGNRTLAAYARRFNANTVDLPTVVDTDRYKVRGTGARGPFTVGWIGSPSTAAYLADLVVPLARLGEDGPVRLVIVGGKAPAIPGVEVIEVPWSEQEEVSLICTFDVGVMPLPDDDWARGKCALKVIQYMACGVPVVASRVGANLDVVTQECGYLVQGDQEWVSALKSLRDREEARRRMGREGRARVERYYSLKGNTPVMANVLRRAAGETV